MCNGTGNNSRPNAGGRVFGTRFGPDLSGPACGAVGSWPRRGDVSRCEPRSGV